MDLCMRIIKRRTLIDYYTKIGHKDLQHALEAWWYEANHANWTCPEDIKRRYATVSIIPGDRAVFNICGNKHRLVVKFNYSGGVGFIKFIGTHKEYDRIDAETI